MWTLLVMVIVSNGVTVTPVPTPYRSAEACAMAGQMAVKLLATERPGSFAKHACIPAP